MADESTCNLALASEKESSKKKEHSSKSSDGHASSSKSHSHGSSSHKSSKSSEKAMEKTLKSIQDQLKTITAGLAHVTPIVTELKSAYDNALAEQEYDFYEAENRSFELSDGEIEENQISDEPPCKLSKMVAGHTSHINTQDGGGAECIDSSQFDSLAKLANKPEPDGPEINAKLAKGVTDLLQLGMNQNHRATKMESIKKPSNCSRLDVVRVNPGLFQTFSKETKTEDIMLQKVQKPLLKGLTHIVRLKNDIHKLEKTQIADILDDAIALIADGSHELDLRRRALLKPGLKPQFKSLASETQPVTDLLFGEDLEKTVEELSKSHKVSATVTVNTSNNRKRKHFSQYNTHQEYSKHKRFPFLGHSQGNSAKGTTLSSYRGRPMNVAHSKQKFHQGSQPKGQKSYPSFTH